MLLSPLCIFFFSGAIVATNLTKTDLLFGALSRRYSFFFSNFPWDALTFDSAP